MEYKQIEYFVETCNHKSFSKAAGSLFISQQALSHCIANLEKELGCVLFTRAVQGIELTADGKYMYDRFRPIVKSFRDAADQTYSYLGNRPVRLPFCCAPGIIRNISPELIIAFSEQHPNIELEMTELNNMLCEEFISEDKRRFGLMLAPKSTRRQKYDFIMIKTEPSYLLVHKDHPLAGCSSVSLAMLENERVLTLDRTSHFLEDLNHAVEPFNFTVKPFFESSDVTQLCGLVDKGKGVLLCIHQIYDESNCKNVVLVPLQERTFDFSVAAVFQDYDALDTAARQFIQFILENIRDDTRGMPMKG